MHADTAVLKPLDVRPVEAGVGAIEQEDAARFEHPGGFRDHGREVVHVGGYPRRDDRPEGLVSERQCRFAMLAALSASEKSASTQSPSPVNPGVALMCSRLDVQAA